MNDIVSNQERDQTFQQIKTIPQNKFCLDCDKKNPSWCSIYLGIHLCMDCAGKHRQYSVIYSFVKSATLDSWTKRQLMFMVKGSNARALEYLKKCGAISTTNRVIDYKSAIVQKYKDILTAQVDGNNVSSIPKPHHQEKKPQQVVQEIKPKETNLQNHAEEIKGEITVKKTKGNKKIKATKINVEEFDNIQFDDGISKAQKEAMIKASDSALVATQNSSSQSDNWSTQSNASSTVPETVKVEQPKQMDEQTAKQTIQMKKQQNVKALSSADFKDTSASSTIQQNLQKLEGKKGFGSSDLYGEEPQQQSTTSKIKNVISDYGQRLYDKFSKYIKK